MAGASNKLTDTAIRNAKPKEKRYKLPDGGGMFLQIEPDGKRYWRLKYRFANKEKLLALGVYPETSLAVARSKRDEAKRLLADGIDPGAQRKAQKLSRATAMANSFEAVAREWFFTKQNGWSASNRDKVLSRLENNLFPWLGARPIAEITAPELLAVLRRTEARGVLETTHRAKQLAGQVFRYAIQTGRAERDPSQDLRGALKTPAKQHLAALTDPKKVGPLLLALDGYSGTPWVKAALQLAPLTFVRPGELRTAKWQDIDLEAAEWRFTTSKTGQAHIVPLSTQAVAILRELYPITGDGTYLFPSPRTNTRPMSDNAVLSAMRRMGIGKDEMCGHGFRAMARTILDEVLGYRPDWIEHQLAHAVKDPNGRAYNRTAHLEGRRTMMQGWADYLDALKTGGKVIPINFKRA